MVTRDREGRTGLQSIAMILWCRAPSFVKRRVGAVIVLVGGAAILTAVAPVALKHVIDTLLPGRTHDSMSVVVPAGLYVAVLGVARVTNDLRELLFARARLRLFRTLREAVFSHLMHLPLRFHLRSHTGAVSQTLDNGIEGLRIALHHAVFTLLPVAVELVSMLVILGPMVTFPFLLLFGGALICYAAVFLWYAQNVSEAALQASKTDVESTALITDALLNYEAVKYFTAERLVEERVSASLCCSESAWVRFHHKYAVSGLLASAIFFVLALVTVTWTTDMVRRGRMSLGGFVLVNTYVLQVVRPVEMLGYALQGLAQATSMLGRLGELLDEPEEAYSDGGEALPGRSAALEFRSVCLSYGSDRRVLDKVSFRIESGHALGIVGSSGSGKSSMVRLLMRLIEPESGVILLEDVPISELTLRTLRCAIAVVPQDTVLFAGSIRDNIALGRVDAKLAEVEAAARIAQLHDRVMMFQAGYDTLVGQRGMKISGGERQRISIARAVLKSPRVFVFDEATSSLDSRTEREILLSLRAISRSTTTLVIAHRLSTVVHADEIAVLENGRIAEWGTHDSLLRREGLYADLWRAQRGGASAA